MREVQPDPGGHRYLLKALGEAGNELAEELFGVSRRIADIPDADGWTLRLLAANVRAFEEMTARYLDHILARRKRDLPVIDTEAMLDSDEPCEDPDHSAMEYAELRRRVQYTLWDLRDRDWSRTGTHPYRGDVSVEDLVRELHHHDLRSLWRAQRLKEEAAARRRR